LARAERLFAVQNQGEWDALCERFLGLPELTDDPRFATGADRVAHRAELDAIVDERFRRSDSGQIREALDAAGIVNSGVNDVTEFLGHPVLASRNRWRDVRIPGGVVQALLPPADLAGTSPRMEPGPDVGEHTKKILAEPATKRPTSTGCGPTAALNRGYASTAATDTPPNSTWSGTFATPR
jgi:itaconate CoA-transferase